MRESQARFPATSCFERLGNDDNSNFNWSNKVTLPKVSSASILPLLAGVFLQGLVLPLTLIGLLIPQTGLAQQTGVADAAKYLPKSTVLFAHISDPAELVETIQDNLSCKGSKIDCATFESSFNV